MGQSSEWMGWGEGMEDGMRGMEFTGGKFGVFIARFMLVMLEVLGNGNRGESLRWIKPSIDTGT